MKNLTGILGGIIGAAIPSTAAATQINYSNPIDTGVYIGLTAGAAFITGLVGYIIGTITHN